jgi:hypothetical protein
VPAPMSAAVRIAKAVLAADDAVNQETVSTETLVELYAAIDKAVPELRQVQAAIAEKCAAVVPPGGAVVGQRFVTPRRSKSRKGWKHDVLNHAVLTAGRDAATAESSVADPYTGEKVPTWDQAVEWIKTFWPLGGNGVRITPLRAIGLDPDEFADTEAGAWTLEVRG